MKIKILSFMLNKKGFTLIELLVSMSIMIILVVMLGDFIKEGFRGSRYASEQSDAIEQARKAMNIMIKEIRGANSSEEGSYALETIDDDNFTYYADLDNDGDMDKIRYFLDTGNIIKKVVWDPGITGDYSTNGATSTVSLYVNNQTEEIFSYYDSSYNITDMVSDVRLIKIILKINVTPEIAPNDYYIESDVHLRNLKDNL